MNIQLTNNDLLKWAGISPEVYTAVQTLEGDEFVVNRNKFLGNLINKICATRIEKASVQNPFKKYDSFPIKYGDTVENIFVSMPMGYDYDITVAGRNLLEPVNPPVDVLYATMNYQKQYKVTIYDTQIRLAVRNEYGLTDLVSFIISSMYDSGDIDEYFATIAMLSTTEGMYANGIEVIDSETKEAKAKSITETILNVVPSFKFPNTINNKLNFINPSTNDDILIVIKQTSLTSVNIDYLAGVFNLSKVELINKIMPVESFVVPVWNPTTKKAELKGNDIDMVIVDTRGFDFHLALNTSGLFYNPEGLYSNHYHNRWRLYGYKLWFNARAFKFTITPPQETIQGGGAASGN